MSIDVKRFITVSLAVVFILCLTSTTLWAGNGNAKKIVVFEEGFVNKAAKSALISKFGGVIGKDLPLVNGMAVALPPAAIKALSANAGVLRIEDDAIVYAIGKGGKKPPKDPPPPDPDPDPAPAQALPWGIDRIDAEAAHAAGYTGAGVNVAVIDTGIDLSHPDLAANIKGGYNAINRRKSAKDDNGHGTHVAGTIAALDNAIGVVGVAPDASLYAVKVLGRNGSGYTSDVIDGINWCINNNIDVVNMSLGSNTRVQALQDACDAAVSAGLILVAAAGNDGGAVDYPGAFDSTIAVAATDENGNRASFSSYGPAVDIAAPGVGILSTYKNGEYAVGDGTSMATPHVAGAIALNLSADIYTTADDIPPTGADDLTGSGLIDAGEIATGIENYGNN